MILKVTETYWKLKNFAKSKSILQENRRQMQDLDIYFDDYNDFLEAKELQEVESEYTLEEFKALQIRLLIDLADKLDNQFKAEFMLAEPYIIEIHELEEANGFYLNIY